MSAVTKEIDVRCVCGGGDALERAAHLSQWL